MKTILAVALCFLSTLCQAAQRTGTAGSPTAILMEIEGKTGRALSLAATQTLANGRVVHDIVATLDMGQAIDVVAMLAQQLSFEGMQPPLLEMIVTFTTSTGTASEVRDYLGVTVSTIELAGFDASSRSAVQLVIRMKALGMRSTTDGSKVSSRIQAKVKPVSQSAYAMTVERVRSNGIDRISSMRFVPCSTAGCSAVTPLEIWVRDVDAEPWRAWFERSVKDPMAARSAEIAMLTPDLKDVLATIRLRNVRPTALADVTTATGRKTHVSLSVEQMTLSVP